MEKINFTDAIETSSAFVTVDGQNYDVNPAQYNGGTNLNANTFNELQDNVEEAIDEAAKEVYSTEEQVIGTWIDDKPLYRTIVVKENLVFKADGYCTSTIEIANVETITSFNCMFKTAETTSYTTYTNNHAGVDYVSFYAYANNLTITMSTNRNATIPEGIMTIEYTKTID